jgi:2-polyprenyl-3-methyl-5-hydroxy-6-metoxy-1,4-benzoquinol methylase
VTFFVRLLIYKVNINMNLDSMYGSHASDPVVKYYDLTLGVSGKHETAWYLDNIHTSGGPVLDLGCGTGRLSLLVAREGFHVTGLDQSPGMLHLFNDKLNQESKEIRKRIQVSRQKMSDFSLDRKFNTIICVDAFFHNTSVDEEIHCLKCVRKHLKPHGRFLFNLPNPNCEFIQKWKDPENQKFEERGRYTLDDESGTILVEQASLCDEFEQTVKTRLRFTRFDAQGNKIDQEESSWVIRYIFKHEAVHLLYRMGFVVKSLVGDYQNGPVKNGSQLIFEVGRA